MTEPPASGPKMKPPPPTSMNRPIAFPLSLRGNAVVSRAMLVAWTAADPSPWNALRPAREARPGAEPAASAPTAKIAAPAR